MNKRGWAGRQRYRMPVPPAFACALQGSPPERFCAQGKGAGQTTKPMPVSDGVLEEVFQGFKAACGSPQGGDYESTGPGFIDLSHLCLRSFLQNTA
jgi:hypothetical protein